MANYTPKTVPNQKVVEVNKQPCNQSHKYSMTNIEAEEKASRDLDAGAFKLWRYFSRNQHGYTFALSSSTVEDTCGIKKKQYDNAVKELIEKGYLVLKQGNNYSFYEIPIVSKRYNDINKESSVVSKGYNDVVAKGYNDVVSKGNHGLYPLDTRNITNNTYNNTNNITETDLPQAEAIQSEVCEKEQQVAPSLGTSVSATSCETSVPKPEGKTRRSEIKGEEGINYIYLTPNIIKTATGKILEIMELRSKGTSYNPREKRKS